MKKTHLFLWLILFLTGCLQVPEDRSYSKPGDRYYEETTNPVNTNLKEWLKVKEDVNVSFASSNIRYPKEKVPKDSIIDSWNVKGWKGEKLHTQILIWTKVKIEEVSFHTEKLIDKDGNIISAKNIKPAFIRYTLADDFGRGCADRDLSEDDSTLVADPIDIIEVMPVEANTVRPVWLSVNIPGDIPSGIYTGNIVIHADRSHKLEISLSVLDHFLPPASEWEYDLDFWQYPSPIARMHGVELWSEEHFEIMRPYFEILADAGQKVITANIIEQPWGLDHVHFDDPSLIKWIKKKNGSWEYDFSLFDKYISFVKDCGITDRINCYSMITWDLSFIYHDENLGKDTSVVLKPGTEEYREYWLPMLKEFTRHLKEKGWFSITSIAMDERPVESMWAIIELLKEIDPEWKIALAGDSYHPEIEKYIYDYSLASYLRFDEDILERRRMQGRPTTFYTACVEEYPAGYTFSPPAENAFMGWHAAAIGYTGYLFWAYNTWVEDPLRDSRWHRYPAGTLFQFYPGPRSSIRFEKIIEGIQAFEKIRILRKKFEKENNESGQKELDHALSYIKIEKLDEIPAAEMIEKANAILNDL